MKINQADINWNKADGLVPAIVQDGADGSVLMLGFMNQEALEKTLQTGKVTFFSRTKQRLWTKGESSGHVLTLEDIRLDCDADTLLIQARPEGPTCHTGSDTCWGPRKSGISFLDTLDALIDRRYRERPEDSYTTKLFERGAHRMAQKVGEEGVEVALAAKDSDDSALLGEAADLLFHLMVLLRSRGLHLADVAKVLADRHRP
ncbi:MAG: bifunctional phosphoribosyl-AMP cyclohydrolase/phosphoribosyl-ATP diphosphatase HisIE [Oligoflexus sp.]|jgi:phosphoribosyl-ATP pyrophosphohydrolase/phosphoribosyl-AMP cyclohydrolase